MSELLWLEIPVKSLTRAKAFYEGFLKDEVTINTEEDSKTATIKEIKKLKSIGYLFEEEGTFIPDTFCIKQQYKFYKDIETQLKKVKLLGGKVLFYEKKKHAKNYQALIRDSEGNRIIMFS